MSKRKLLFALLRLIICVLIVLLLWVPITEIVFYFTLGPEPRFDMGNDYEIMFHGYVTRWINKEEYDVVIVIHDTVEEFIIKNPWLIGKTEVGWFAIQKIENKPYYPISFEDIRNITGLDISRSEFLTQKDRRPYAVLMPSTESVVFRAKIVLILISPVVAFAPNVFGFILAIAKKKKQPHSQ